MRRRRQIKTAENTDRWLVSYADFITLLFAFFVLMFAVSQADKNNARAVSDAIKKALAAGGTSVKEADAKETSPHPASVKPAAVPDNGAQALADSMAVLQEKLKSEIGAGIVRLSLEHRGLVISLEAGAFFPSAAADVSPEAYSAVEKVANVINGLPNQIRLEGHTDSLPISNARFRSNWELSASRSIAMLHLLSERFGVDSRRMAIVGYADNVAIDSNNTETGRIRNRRVDIVIAAG